MGPNLETTNHAAIQCSKFRTDFTPKRGAKGQQARDLTLEEGRRDSVDTDVVTRVLAGYSSYLVLGTLETLELCSFVI